jgi:integral membrane protein (TIGR01906 family)
LDLKPAVGAIATLLLGLGVALAILAANGLALVFDADFYARGEIEQQVESVYGLSQSTLVPVNRAIVHYFGTPTESLAQALQSAGANPAFFNPRETTHMDDVRGLIGLVGALERIALAVAVLSIVALVALHGRGFLPSVGTGLAIGGALAVGLVAVLGVITMIDFGGLFVQLHLMSFSNDFWLLDPKTDRLIQMFPFGFWRNGMIALVIRWLATGVVVFVVGVIVGRMGRRLA